MSFHRTPSLQSIGLLVFALILASLCFGFVGAQAYWQDTLLQQLYRIVVSIHPDSFMYGSGLLLSVLFLLFGIVLIPGIFIIIIRMLRSRKAKGGPTAAQALRRLTVETVILLLVYSLLAFVIFVVINNRKAVPPMVPVAELVENERAKITDIEVELPQLFGEVMDAPALALAPAENFTPQKRYGRLAIPLMLAAAALGLAFWVLKPMILLFRSQRGAELQIVEPEPEQVADGLLVEALQKTRMRLDTGDDVRNSIIACFAELSALTGDSNEPDRLYTLTARELGQYVLAKGVPTQLTAQLTQLFERARYSQAVCSEQDRQQALHLLEVILGGLSREAPQA